METFSKRIQKFLRLKNVKTILLISFISLLLLSVSLYIDKKEEETTLNYQEETDEQKVSGILQKIEGVGKNEVIITYDQNNNVAGVIVLAEGAEDPIVRIKIKQVIRTALQVENEKIRIFQQHS